MNLTILIIKTKVEKERKKEEKKNFFGVSELSC